MKEHIKVFLAFLTNNRGGKQVDVHGRTYRDVYKRFGHGVMLHDYQTINSWVIK